MGKFFGTESVFKMKIWLNGKFVKEDEAKVDIISNAGSDSDSRH